MNNIKAQISFLVILIVAIFVSSSCEHKMAQSAKPIDSTFYITKDIKLYANIDTLIKNGIVSPSVTGGSKYIANDTHLYGINFQEADVNFASTNLDSLRNISYGIYVTVDTLQTLYGQLYKKMVEKYNSPSRITSPKQNGDHVGSAVWYKKGMVIILHTTIPENEPKGVIIITFTTPKDTVYFDTFMH